MQSSNIVLRTDTRDVIKKLPLFVIFSKSIYLFINNYLFPLNVIPLIYNIHLCQRFSNPRDTLKLALWPLALWKVFVKRHQYQFTVVLKNWRILHKVPDMMPHKVQLVQELKPIDHPMRFRFAKWACDQLTEDDNFGKKIIFSDENHF